MLYLRARNLDQCRRCAGISIWPQHCRPKYILLTWVIVTLIIASGEQNFNSKRFESKNT